jgi:arylsulfatase A-like enzyme
MRTLALAALVLIGAAPAATKPNIVVILADDLGIGDLTCYNADSKIATPAMNRFATEGMRFTDVHTPSSVCTPTRYALLTGRYAWRSRLKKGVLFGFDPALIEEGRPTIASHLQSKGYRTGGFGKWHLGFGTAPKIDYAKPLEPGPLTIGFDEYQGIPASLDMEPYVWVKDRGVEAAPSETIPGSKHQRQGGNGFYRGGPAAPGYKHAEILPRVTQVAVEFIGRQSKDAPFFAYIPLPSPHDPWVPNNEYTGTSMVGAYGDYVMETDAAVGRILEALEKTGLAKETLVVVTSDNGSHWPEADIAKWNHRANGPWRGQKADIHEAGHRVPFLVRWPGTVAPGATCDATACLVDLFATVCDLSGDKPPENGAEDSFSLLGALKGGALQRAPVIHHSSNGMFALRDGALKFIEGQGSGGFTKVPVTAADPPGQLYDLAADPAETKNLYSAKPDEVARLSKLLNDARDRGRTRP